MNNKLSSFFACVKNEVLSWVCSAKMMIVLILVVFIYNLVSQPLCQAASEMNTQINILEPIIALGTSGVVLLIIPLVFLFLISDFPRANTISCLHIVRMSKKRWLAMQITTLGLEVFLFLFFIAIVNIVLIWGVADWSLDWSKVATSYAAELPDKANDFVDNLLPENLYLHMDLIMALIHTYALLFLYLLMLGMILIVASLLNVKYLGILVNALLVVIGAALCALKVKAMWLLPMAHTVIWLHYTEYFREPIVNPAISYLYLGVANILLVVCSVWLVKKYRFT